MTKYPMTKWLLRLWCFVTHVSFTTNNRLTSSARVLLGGLLLPWFTGCSPMFSELPPPGSHAFLRPVETAPESVALEIFLVRIPANDRQLTEELWGTVDEGRFEVELRRDLVRNGFRAGVLGSTLPDVLARHLNLQSEMPEMTTEQLITDKSADPSVVRRVIQLNRHEPAIVQASDLKEKQHVLISSDSGLQGRSYHQVQAVYSLRAEPVVGQRVLLSLTPELQHGELRNRYTGSEQGIFLLKPSRERETYDQLKLKVELAAGELLVVGCLSDSPGSLGYAFHAVAQRGPAEHKLILVRLLQVPGSEILANIGPK